MLSSCQARHSLDTPSTLVDTCRHLSTLVDSLDSLDSQGSAPWRARGQHGTPPITEKRYCLCAYARAALHTSALSECCAAAVALQNQGAAARGRSRRSSRLRPIGNLRPGRGGQATQTRRQQLVQDSPALPTRHGLEAQKPWRWIIIIYRGESRVGTPFQPWMQHV